MRNYILPMTIAIVAGLLGFGLYSQAQTIQDNQAQIEQLQTDLGELRIETQAKEIELQQKNAELKAATKQQQELQRQTEDLQRQLSARQNANRAVSARSSAKVVSTVGCEAYRPLVAQYSWNVETAMQVMRAESGCNPLAVSPTQDHGLFQLHNRPVYDPAQNIAIAYSMWQSRGWQPWSVCRTRVACV